MLWRVVARAMLATQESGDPLALAQAARSAIEAHRDAGDWDTGAAQVRRPCLRDTLFAAAWHAVHRIVR